MYQLIDKLPAWALGAIAAAIMLLAMQLGRMIGKVRPPAEEPHELPQATTVAAALLALLGLLLAFAFSSVETRFAARRQLLLEDANAISTTYLRAGILAPDQRDAVRAALCDYVDVRLGATTPAGVDAALVRTNEIQRALWLHAEDAGRRDPQSEMAALFVESLNRMIDLHQSRLTVVIAQRLPANVFVMIGVVEVLAIMVLGYAGGVSASRARLPPIAVALAIACVTTLIVDLDRPFGQLFPIDHAAMRAARASFETYAERAVPRVP